MNFLSVAGRGHLLDGDAVNSVFYPDRPDAGLLAFSQLIVALDYNIVYVALPDIGQ